MSRFSGFGRPRRRPFLRGALIAAGLLVIGAAGKIAWRLTHLPVFFDNALSVPVTITVDGTAFPVAAGARVERSLPPGSYDVTVTGPAGEIERYTADMPAPRPLDALGDPGFFVYDVSERRVYLWEELGYAPKKDEHRRTYRREVIGLQRFFAQDAVDDLFRQPPKTIPGDGSDTVEKRTAFNVAPHGLVDYAVDRSEEGDFKEAEKALRKAIALAPCGVSEWRTLLAVLWRQNRPEMALAAAREWTSCPGVDPHRYYQENARRAGQEKAVLAEYRERLAAHPEVGANHYLYGRLLEDLDQQIAAYRAAVQRDPTLARAQMALGAALLAEERPAEAFEALGHVLELPGHPDEVNLTYAEAAVGAGTLGPADQELKKRAGGKPEGIEAVAEARRLLALAGGRLDDAQSLLNAHEEADPDDSANWRHRVLLLRLTGKKDKLDRELVRAAHRDDLARDLARAHLDLALEEKRFGAAAAVVDKEMAALYGGPGVLDRLYAAAALLLAGDGKSAGERLTRLAADLETHAPNPDHDTALAALLVDALRRPLPPDEVVKRAARIDFQSLPHAYFILGVRATAEGDTAAARGFFEKSRKTALDLEFPYLAAAGLVGQGG